MTLHRPSFFSRGHVPQFHFAWTVAVRPRGGGWPPASDDRSQGLAVRRKRHLEGIALERVQLLAGGDVPQVHRETGWRSIVVARPGQHLAVRREGHVKRAAAGHFDNDSFFLLWRWLFSLGLLVFTFGRLVFGVVS